MDPENVPEVLAVMATAGLYDDTGQWLYATGLPAKSGVGGGILAVSPGLFGIARVAAAGPGGQQRPSAQKAITDFGSAGRQPLRRDAEVAQRRSSTQRPTASSGRPPLLLSKTRRSRLPAVVAVSVAVAVTVPTPVICR